MAKYKLRRAKLNKTSSIAVVLIAVLVFMSIGYCIWTDNQTIIGNFILKYKEPPLENVVIVKNDSGEYLEKQDSGSVKALKLKENTLIQNDDIIEITARYEGAVWIVVGRQVTLSFSFINNSPYVLDSPSYEVLEKDIYYDPTVTLSSPVPIGEPGTISISFRARSGMAVETGKIRYRFSYKYGEVTRYVYLTVIVE